MMSNQLFLKWTLIFITSFLLTSQIFSEQEKSVGGQPKISQQFYELLIEINDDYSSVQISKLEKFVTDYPGFSRSAIWLFDRYILAKDLNRAERFFSNLPDSDLSRITKNWMMGKVYSRQGISEGALIAFTSALTATSPSPELILDFFIFDIDSLRKFEDPDYLAELALDNEAIEMMHALWNYINRQWQPAINKFNTLSDELQNNLTILYSWGYCLNGLGQDQLAIEKWKKGLETSRIMGDRQLEAKFLLQLGIIAPTLETTLSYYDSSYAIARQIHDLKRLEFLAGNRGILYSRQGRFSRADSLYREAMDAGRQMQSAWRMSVWYPRLGNLLVQQDRFDEALKAYDEGADLARKAGNTEILIRCQIREGELYRVLGQYELARRALTGAYIEAQDRGEPRFERQAHVQLAHLDFATHRYAEARRVYATYLKNSPVTRHDLDDHAWWRFRTGLTYLAENNYAAARSELSKASVLADSIEANFRKAASLVYLAQIDLIENDGERAHERLNECLTLAKETEIGQVLPALYSLRGDAYKMAGELEKSVPHYKKAANLIEKIRGNLTSEASKLDYFGDKADIYDKLVDCYREIYAVTDNAAYMDSLYAYIEIKRSRTLRELRSENGTQAQDTELDFQRDKLQELQDRLKSQQRYLRDHRALFTKGELDSVLAQVQTSRRSLIAQKLRLTQPGTLDSDALLAKMPSLEKLSSILRANESAAIFYHLSEHPFALVLAGDTTAVVTLPTTMSNLDASIQSLLKPFHGVTEIAKVIFKAGMAHELYRTLVAPIEEAIPLPTNILIAPDAQIANLPFELLLTKKPDQSQFSITDSATYADDFLIHDYSIGYIPNASFLAEADHGTASQNVLVFADPNLSVNGIYNPLIYSTIEANSIKEAHSNTTIFRRENATKETLFQEAPSYDIIHFATHAFVDTTHDAFSGLVLSTSDDKEDDGILMGYEIADMDLQADLVTLSACETGRGKVMPGEGVLGLPRLFLGAGANTVLMTHWKVDDKFTADIMVDFYDHYLKQGLPKARALAEAKRNVLNSSRKSREPNYRHPFYWAPFALYGEPGFRKPGHVTEFVIAAVSILLISLLLVGLKNTMKKTASIAHKKSQ